MNKLGSLFDNYTILIYYDHSSDDSLQILKDYQEQNQNMILYVNKNPVSPFRTHNIAVARNFCLDYVKQHQSVFPYFIMMDMDDVNCKELKVEPLAKHLLRDDWDALSFNTRPAYYDIWGLSIWPYCFSYNHFENNVQFYDIIQKYITQMLEKLEPGALLPCISSFNGLSIYRTHKFLNTSYDGYGVGANTELLYEGIDSGVNGSRQLFVSTVWECLNAEYSYNCHGCNHIFGCIGLRKKQYCILNKQYDKKTYEKIKSEIISKMKERKTFKLGLDDFSKLDSNFL
jgi:hypothetical protein